MADTLDTLWAITPHTKAKHAILGRYLNAWLPIISAQDARLKQQYETVKGRQILYIDGFAGPGVYTQGEPGSPLIALRAARQHNKPFPSPVKMLFVEQSEDRYVKLCEVLRPEIERTKSVRSDIEPLQPIHGECDAVLNDLLARHESQGIRFGPALAFLDQFGYGEVSMNLIQRILRFPQCEVFTYLEYKGMNRWITDPNKAPVFNRAYGGSEWQQCTDLEERERRTQLLQLYKSALQTRGGARYVTAFSMSDCNNVPLYWLFFCTNSLRGLEEMKKAMWTVDKTGEFRFSDRDNTEQPTLLDVGFSQDWLAEELREKLAGKELTVSHIREYVLVNTPCCLFKSALKQLETGKKKCLTVVRQPSERRPGTYPDGMLDDIVLQFPSSLFAS